jgi:hypothetical protein
VFNAPKVYAIPAGYGIVKGGFFHIPTNKKSTKLKDDSRGAFIKVVDGEITAQNLMIELERLLPGHGPWKIDQLGPKSFRTIFSVV